MTTFNFYAIIKPTNETGGCFIMTWKVWHCYLQDGWIKENVINIKADNYDEAISKARKFDMRYCCAQVVDDNA